MRLLHLSDLHLGKRVHEYSMLSEQRHVLAQIMQLARAERVDVVCIAGDVYDKSVPPGDAVRVLDDFLTQLVDSGLPVLLISGNHDSPERLSFLGGLLHARGLYIESVYAGKAKRVTLKDAQGDVDFYLLPYVKPAKAAPFFEGEEIESYEDAVRLSLAASEIDPARRNVLLAHQLFTFSGEAALRTDSESLSIGGVENVDVQMLEAFDYVALGHLHRAQRVGRESIRYAGSPLKYSFSEASGDKSVTIVDLGEKGEVAVRLLPLTPLHDMREIRGPIAALLEAAKEPSYDYIRAILTDTGEVHDALARLRHVYPNLMRLDFERQGTETLQAPDEQTISAQTPQALFEAFFVDQRGSDMTAAQREILREVLEGLDAKEEAQ